MYISHVYTYMCAKIHSDLPAGEVLASHAAAISTTEVENVSTVKTDITQPTYHGYLVSYFMNLYRAVLFH